MSILAKVTNFLAEPFAFFNQYLDILCGISAKPK
jgi:hypothetical protein